MLSPNSHNSSMDFTSMIIKCFGYDIQVQIFWYNNILYDIPANTKLGIITSLKL